MKNVKCEVTMVLGLDGNTVEVFLSGAGGREVLEVEGFLGMPQYTGALLPSPNLEVEVGVDENGEYFLTRESRAGLPSRILAAQEKMRGPVLGSE